jgi:hypothetical protein
MSAIIESCHCGHDGPFMGTRHKEGFLSMICPECKRQVSSFSSRYKAAAPSVEP